MMQECLQGDNDTKTRARSLSMSLFPLLKKPTLGIINIAVDRFAFICNDHQNGQSH